MCEEFEDAEEFEGFEGFVVDFGKVKGQSNSLEGALDEDIAKLETVV
jgi:hypothetical protein